MTGQDRMLTMKKEETDSFRRFTILKKKSALLQNKRERIERTNTTRVYSVRRHIYCYVVSVVGQMQHNKDVPLFLMRHPSWCTRSSLNLPHILIWSDNHGLP